MPTARTLATPQALPVDRPSLRAGARPTLTDRIALGATRVGLKALFTDLRWQLPAGGRGLNNSFTAPYARTLIEDHPQWASAFERRRRRTP
ncbi:hypothetical protein ABZ896_37860 [Streptomyces sp. NPDC047072]|uniref:hypothetical protein n=1 Tax=Streptomyces sp. NPDC047072 TaxID=3154809 RepID=UPI00340E300A